MENKIKSLLLELGIIDEASICAYYHRVRDRQDVSVLRCTKSGVIFLSRSDHMDVSSYETKNNLTYWRQAPDRKTAVLTGYEDTRRRFEQFKNIIANKRWLDVGTGVGGILDLLSPLALRTTAVEPQKKARELLADAGYEVYSSVNQLPDHAFDVITLFHVFEHLSDPLDTLKILKNKMSSGGKIIIEVPHARDILISFFDLEAFKAFTFWSEHLILHVRDSLRIFLEKAGFSNITIGGHQRYPLANHYYWLSKKKPGGHLTWDFLRTTELDTAYADMLAKLDMTDTLIAVAIKEK